MKHFSLKYKFAALLTAATLLLPVFTGAAASDESNPSEWLQEQIDREESIGTLEAPAKIAHKEIKLSWEDESGNVIYPDTFGGFHLNDDYKLLIKLVNNDPVLKQQILDVVTDDSVLVFENATASYTELCDLVDSITPGSPFFDAYYIYSAGVYTPDNVVEVRVRADPDTAASLVMYNAAYPNIRIVPLTPIEPEEDAQPTTLSDMVTAAADAILTIGKR